MKRILVMLPSLLLLLAACHRDNAMSNTNPVLVGNIPEPSIPTGAVGALYAINNTGYQTNGSAGYDTTNFGDAYAWFIDSNWTKNAGNVAANSVSLINTPLSSNDANPWYGDSISYMSNTVAWAVQGDSITGVPAFNYTDNTAFPLVTGLALPQLISTNSPLTIQYTITGAYDQVYYSISGSISTTGAQAGYSFIHTGNSASSVTFSAAQLHQLMPNGGSLTFEIMLVKLTPFVASGKTFYFVKQSNYSISSVVQ